VHVAQPAFIDEREACDACMVARKRSAHFIEETAIDLKDDFEMRKQCAKKVDRPFLECLREQRMIRVAKGCTRNGPRLLPVESVFVDEQPHQFGDGNRGVRVVELHGPLFVKIPRRAAEQGVDAQHVLQRTAAEEELLLKPEFLAAMCLVVRVQHLGDRL